MFFIFILLIIIIVEQHNFDKQFECVYKILIDQDIRLKELEQKNKKNQ